MCALPHPYTGRYHVYGDEKKAPPGEVPFLPIVTSLRHAIGQWKSYSGTRRGVRAATRKAWKRKVFGIVITRRGGAKRYYVFNNFTELKDFVDNFESVVKGNDPEIEYYSYIADFSEITQIQSGWIDTFLLPGQASRSRGLHLSGHFFPFYNTEEKIDLSPYQIYTKEQWTCLQSQPRVHCIVFALRICGLDMVHINSICYHVRNGKFPLSAIEKHPEIFPFKIHLSWYSGEDEASRTKTKTYGKGLVTYNLALFKGHYFANHFIWGGEYKEKMLQYIPPKNRSFAKPLGCIRAMWNSDKFEPFGDTDDFGSRATEDDNIISEINESTTILVKPKQPLSEFEKHMWSIHKSLPSDYTDDYLTELAIYEGTTSHDLQHRKRPNNRICIFFDVESDTSTYDIHYPLLICFKVMTLSPSDEIMDISDTYTSFTVHDFFLHEKVTDGSILYAHWAKYDVGVLMSCPSVLIVGNPLEKGSMLYKYKLLYSNRGIKKRVEVRNTYALIPMKLAQFASMFSLPVHKSFCPFEYLTRENFMNDLPIDVTDYLARISSRKATEFKEAMADIDMQPESFHIRRYSIEYCKKDVDVMLQGYLHFRQDLMNITERHNQSLDLNNFLSLPSISMQFYNVNDAYTDVLMVGGAHRLYLQKAVYGGCCRMRKNTKHRITQDIYDFDAVSLYPSAMSRLARDGLGYPTGEPRYFRNVAFTPGFEGLLPHVTGNMYYVVYVRIDSAINLEMPILPRPYQTIPPSTEPVSYAYPFQKGYYFLDKISLEDAHTYQNADFTIINGLYFPKGYNPKVSELTEVLFNERLKAKSENNVIEKLYKLLLNSAYGKNGEQEHPTMVQLFNDEQKFWTFLYRHSDLINTATSFPRFGSDSENFCVKYYTPIRDHYSLPHCASIILSMSKRIMWEVIHCIPDLPGIYYQDTDSMQILKSSVPLLEDAYRTKYNRELIGNQLGQFHNDFSGGDHSIKTIICGKKAYCCLLDTGKVHARLKGVPSGCLHPNLASGEPMSEQDYLHVVSIFDRLYEGEEIEFDCLEYCRFKHDLCSVQNRQKFNKKIAY